MRSRPANDAPQCLPNLVSDCVTIRTTDGDLNTPSLSLTRESSRRTWEVHFSSQLCPPHPGERPNALQALRHAAEGCLQRSSSLERRIPKNDHGRSQNRPQQESGLARI